MENRSAASGSASKRPRLDSNIMDTNATDPCPATPKSTQERTVRNATDTVTPCPVQEYTNRSSRVARCTVFISHASEDKVTIAMPLRERLRAKGITAFVDDADMACGTDAVQAMTLAMKTAKIGVMILSPEFVAKEWPMKEAMHFLKRREECLNVGNEGCEAPTIIPFFYRLSVHDVYKEPRVNSKDPDDIVMYEKSRFFERQKNGEAEADVEKIKATLQTLHGIMGVRNDFDANNESSLLMNKRRELLLDELSNKIYNSVPEEMRMRTWTDTTERRNRESCQADNFRRLFPPKLLGKKGVLDFGGWDAQGDPMTPEGLVKRYLLEAGKCGRSIVSLHGIGGVGKSTIVEVLMSDEDTRKRFPDGVHVMKLGSDATRNVLLECMCCILEESGAEKKVQSLRERNKIDEVLKFFMSWFEGRRCVFFIDDVWERSVNIRVLSRLCDIVRVDGGNMVLMTTREHEIASLTEDARIVTLNPRESRGEVARQMLFFHAGVAENDVSITDAGVAISEILDICAGLPVNLAVAGKQVRKLIRFDKRHGASVWARYLSRLHANPETLLRQNVGSYGNLYATFAASLSFLDEEIPEEKTGFRTKYLFAEMHRQLCVIQKQAAVPNRMLMHLWGTESEESAETIAMSFVEVGLGGHETVQNKSELESRFSMHDSIHDFAVAEARRHDEVAKAHDLLLEGYGSGHEEVCVELGDKTVRWWSRGIEVDGYIHKQLCRHLVESGRKTELCELLLTPAWAERQIEVNGVMCLEDDFEMGMKEIREDEEAGEALSLIANAISLSSVHVVKNASELWFQVHGRLKGYDQGNMKIEKYVKWIGSDTWKPRVLSVHRILVGAGGRNTKIISVGGVGVEDMTLFPDGEHVVCGCLDGNIVVVDIRRSKIEREWWPYGHFIGIRMNAIASQNGTLVVTMPGDKSTVDVWDVESGNRVKTFGGHPGFVSCFAITQDETCVLCVSKKGSLQLCDMKSGEVVVPGMNVGCGAEKITLLKDGERAMIGYGDGKLKLWNMNTGAKLGEVGDAEMYCFTLTPDKRRVVCGSKDGAITLWDLESGQQLWSSRGGDHIRCVSVSLDGSQIASGDGNGEIRIWKLESGDQLCEPLKGHTSYVAGVLFFRNENSIVSCSRDCTLRVWNTARGQEEKSFATLEGGVTVVSFTPDGRFVVTGSEDGVLRIWEVKCGEIVGDPLEGYSTCVTDVGVTPDGRFVVSVSLDKTIRVWDFKSRKLLRTLEGHTDCVNSVAVTPKGDRAVSGSDDKTVRVWNLTKMDGSHVVFERHSEGHSSGVQRVFVSDDGLRVISADLGNKILVWSLETKEVLKTAVVGDAQDMSRREVFGFIGEDTVHDDAGLSIRLWSKQIIHQKGSEARVLATLGSKIVSWDISPDKKTICLGLTNGQVVFLEVDV